MLIISFLSFFLYLIIARIVYIRKFNCFPESISKLANCFDHSVFVIAFCILIGTLFPVWITYPHPLLVIISCISLLCVGITPNYQTNSTAKKIHFTGAYLGSISSVLYIILINSFIGLIPILLCMISGIILTDIKKTWVYWFELGLFYSIFINLALF